MKTYISYILTLFSTVFTYGQVQLLISKVSDQKVNQKFNLTILLEISGENMEQQTPLMMPDLSKFDIIGSASDQKTIIVDNEKGNFINQLVYQYVLSPKKPGSVKIGSVLVKVNDKIYKTEPFDIMIREAEKTSVAATSSEKSDLYLNLEIKDQNVYKNEPTLAILRAYSKEYDNFRKVGKIHFNNQKNVNIKPISYAKSEIETKGGINSQVIGVFMILPSESGKLEISPISASITSNNNQSRLASNRTQLNVKKLPDGMPHHYKNAVGQFTIELVNKNPTEIVEIEQPLNIVLKVAGTGNLTNLHLPKIIASDDYTFYEPKITTVSSAKKDHLQGFVSAEYVIIPKKSGLIRLKFEDFSYFDPQDNKYVDLGSKALFINVQTQQQIADAKTTLEKVNEYTNNVLETVNTPVLQTNNLKIKTTDQINWSIILGNGALLASILSLFLILRKNKKRIKSKPKLIRKPSTNIAETEELIRKNLQNNFEENIEYLKILKDNKDFVKFFSTYDELQQDIMKSYSVNNESAFRAELEKKKGKKISEQYRHLCEKIQIEKFSPFHENDQMDSLYESIQELYHEISK